MYIKYRTFVLVFVALAGPKIHRSWDISSGSRVIVIKDREQTIVAVQHASEMVAPLEIVDLEFVRYSVS